MTIVTKDALHLPVWKGSIWYSRIYEFNDSADIPGLQPDFEFACPIIEKYFNDLEAAVNKREVEETTTRQERELSAESQKQNAIATIRQRLLLVKP